jgi:hypothetical protein
MSKQTNSRTDVRGNKVSEEVLAREILARQKKKGVVNGSQRRPQGTLAGMPLASAANL